MKRIQIHEIIEARLIRDYVVEVVFDDFKKARIDFKKYLGKGVFKDLLNKNKFKHFKVDAELGTICWPNGADIAPETLYDDAVQQEELNDRLKQYHKNPSAGSPWIEVKKRFFSK